MSGKHRLLLLSTTSKIGGTEQLVLNLAKGMRKLDCDVQTVLAEDDDVSATLEWFEREGVQASASPDVLTIYQRHTLKSLLKLRKLVQESGAVAVNIQYGGSHFSFKDVAAIRAAGVTCVVSVQHANRIEARRHRLMTRLGARLADAIVVSTEAARDVLLEAKVPAESIHVIPPSVKPPSKRSSRDGARRRLGLPASAFVVGCLARLTPEKGIAELIDAVAQMPDPEQRLQLVIAGAGPAADALRERAAARLPGRAQFLGRIDNSGDLYAASDVFALPSHMEGFGLVFIEAAYYGVPSVATRVGGVPFAVEHGKTGLLVDLYDIDGLTRAITQLRDDPALCKRLGDAARVRAEREFSGRAMAERYRRVLFAKATEQPAPADAPKPKPRSSSPFAFLRRLA
ncbi:MAG TPA: glycosyltransferase family 4 protein [Polyangiaceae bacterium]